YVGSHFGVQDSSSYDRPLLTDGSINGFHISTLRRADYKRERGAYHHYSSDHFERLAIIACALTHARDQGRPTHPSETPGRQHQPINGTDVSRTKEVGRKSRHRSEAP